MNPRRPRNQIVASDISTVACTKERTPGPVGPGVPVWFQRIRSVAKLPILVRLRRALCEVGDVVTSPTAPSTRQLPRSGPQPIPALRIPRAGDRHLPGGFAAEGAVREEDFEVHLEHRRHRLLPGRRRCRPWCTRLLSPGSRSCCPPRRRGPAGRPQRSSSNAPVQVNLAEVDRVVGSLSSSTIDCQIWLTLPVVRTPSSGLLASRSGP